MTTIHSVNNGLVLWQYEDMHVLGIQGTMDILLDNIKELCKDYALEFGNVRREAHRDFLAAFCFETPIDITFARAHDGEASILTYSTDKDKSMELIYGLAEKSRLKVYDKPTHDFIDVISGKLGAINVRTYEQCKLASRLIDQNISNVFGTVYYANFLNRYKGFSHEESLRLAGKKFSLPVEKFMPGRG